MNKKYIFIIAIILVVAGGLLLNKKEENKYEFNEALYTNEDFRPQSEESIEKFGSSDNIIKVHITGEINNPGLIELNSESRILDAIEKAGGTTPLADISKVNLAYMLSDGEKIYIPSINDEDTNYINSTNSNSKININTASVQDLKSLNGVGESTAQAIVNYRKENGKFSNIEDLKNVSGIGESKFNKIKDYICIK